MHATSTGIIVALWTATAVAAFGIGWITPPWGRHRCSLLHPLAEPET
jgi:hypothetical protein